jgi:hypothetical protein
LSRAFLAVNFFRYFSRTQYTLLLEAFMISEAIRRAPMLTLRELVDRYITLAGEFGRPVALAAFGLSQAEAERVFSSYDEDYHISRFLHFSEDAGNSYSINGEPVTRVSIDAEIESIL